METRGLTMGTTERQDATGPNVERDDEETQTGHTRRSFLRGAALTTGALAGVFTASRSAEATQYEPKNPVYFDGEITYTITLLDGNGYSTGYTQSYAVPGTSLLADPVAGFEHRESNPYHLELWSTDPLPSHRSHILGGELGSSGPGTVNIMSATISNNRNVWAVEEFLEQHWALEFRQSPNGYFLLGRCLEASGSNYVSGSGEWGTYGGGLTPTYSLEQGSTLVAGWTATTMGVKINGPAHQLFLLDGSRVWADLWFVGSLRA